jgi:ParB family chromosome partitioning protein
MERRALGKGISALIPEREPETGDRTAVLKLDLIKPSSLQPREDFDAQALGELTQSIKQKGLIQPLVVRRKGDYYELIAGERRFRAAHALQLNEVPVIIKEDVGDQEALEMSLIENIQRQDLNPIEEARAYQYLMHKFQISQEKLGELLGKARVTVANAMRLLNLPAEVQDEIKRGRISFAHGRALLEINDVNRQRRLTQEVISQRLSVRELENLIKMYRPRARRGIPPAQRQPYLAVLEEALQHALATKVRISMRKKRGHIRIEFYSQEDLERITGAIKKDK